MKTKEEIKMVVIFQHIIIFACLVFPLCVNTESCYFAFDENESCITRARLALVSFH